MDAGLVLSRAEVRRRTYSFAVERNKKVANGDVFSKRVVRSETLSKICRGRSGKN